MIPSVQVFQNLSLVVHMRLLVHNVQLCRSLSCCSLKVCVLQFLTSVFVEKARVFPRVCATEQPLRELEEDMPISSGDDMQVAVFPARISMS